MEENTAKQEQATEVKTFTEEDVNRIVTDRLHRERQKYDGINLDELKAKAAKLDEIEEANKTEIQKANEKAEALEIELKQLKKANEVREIRDKVAKETGVPYSLLTAETEEECRNQAQAVLDYKQIPYPAVKDGGEVQGTVKHSTRDQFAEYMNQLF
jgi:hypothetical protein